MTLATLVIMIIASSSMKLPKVSWPIESENDRIRWTSAAKTMGIGTGSGCRGNIGRNSPQGELAPAPAGLAEPVPPRMAGGWQQAQTARPGAQSAGIPASLTTFAQSATSDLMISAN